VRGVVVPFNASANRSRFEIASDTDLSFDGSEAAVHLLASCFYLRHLCKNAILAKLLRCFQTQQFIFTRSWK
jgi:hypothetical protein